MRSEMPQWRQDAYSGHPAYAPEYFRQVKRERLDKVGRLSFELEQYIVRCVRHDREPTIAALRTLLRESQR